MGGVVDEERAGQPQQGGGEQHAGVGQPRGKEEEQRAGGWPQSPLTGEGGDSQGNRATFQLCHQMVWFGGKSLAHPVLCRLQTSTLCFGWSLPGHVTAQSLRQSAASWPGPESKAQPAGLKKGLAGPTPPRGKGGWGAAEPDLTGAGKQAKEPQFQRGWDFSAKTLRSILTSLQSTILQRH